MGNMKDTALLLENFIVPLLVLFSKAIFVISGAILFLATLYAVWLIGKFIAKESWEVIAENFDDAPYGTVIVVSFVMFICSSMIVLGTGI
jgi:hypothetical protein